VICIPIAASTGPEVLSDLEKAEKVADLIELRLDLLPRDTWLLLLNQLKKPLIVTLRPERQGGRFKGEEAERIRLLEEVLSFKPAFIDVEWDTPTELVESLRRKKKGETRLLLSYHDFQGTPDDLEGIWERIDFLDPDLVKIVTYAKSIEDNARILRLAQHHRDKTIAFCMGPVGLPSRILTLRFGGLVTYASLDKGQESAPGQIPVQELRDVYRVKEIGQETRVFGLVGNPVSHSLSPLIHNAAFKALEVNAVYIPFQVPDLNDLLPTLQFLEVHGFSVTIPYKQEIISLLDEADEVAGTMGAVNTVCRRDGRWMGTNTDGDGAWKALQTADVHLRNKRWTLLGAGGVARAVAYCVGMHGRPRSLTFLGRSSKKLSEMVDDTRQLFSFPIDGALLSENGLRKRLDLTDILVNCTPVGMFPRVEETPLSPHLLSPSHLVFDTVYNPLETRLFREAKERGCHTVSGLEMFLFQGAAQFELWTGKSAPLPLMRVKALERLET